HVHAGEMGELILTTLERTGSPLLRYRTGDLVKESLDSICVCGRSEIALEGGILGRTDDMVVVRGVNVYPSAIEEIVRAQVDVAEYQVTVDTRESLTELTLAIEVRPQCPDPNALAQHLATTLQTAFNLRVPVTVVAPGTLPRSEMKAQRWIRAPAGTSSR